MCRNVSHRITVAVLGLAALFVLSIALQLDLPKPTGAYPVGRRTLRWVDTSRPEVLTDAPADFREVIAEFWYPAEAGTGTKAAYIPDLAHLSQGLVASGEVASLEVFGLRFIRSENLSNAQIASTETSYPIVLLSPGNGTNVEFYASMADELASHGYIVVGINHPYDVAAVALTDGRIAQFTNQQEALEGPAREAFVAERIAVRTTDVRFARDQLAALNASGQGAFAGRLDLARVGIMGHSLGGITAAEVCRAALQFRVCLNFDGLQRGGPFSTNENAIPPSQPFMMITKERQLHQRWIAQFKAIPAGSYRVVLNGASHENFTDSPLLKPSLLPVPNEADRILTLTRAYSLAFFDQSLKGQLSDLLAESSQSEAVSLEVYPPH